MTALLVLPDGREIYSGEVGQDAILRLTLTAGVNDTRELTLGSVCAAMLEAERIARDPSVKHYSDVEEALRELKR